MDQLSFIILRHVANEHQNLYWNKCYECIRKYYNKEVIYIIDDHSTYTPKSDKKLLNTYIINSEFPPNRGELLPYYYFYTKSFSKNTVILHDTVFINSKIDPKFLNTTTAHFLWSSIHRWDPNNRILQILKKMDNSDNLISLFNDKTKWDVCFGGMSIVNLKYIRNIFNNTNYFKILSSEITCRRDRMCFERIISLLLTDIKTESVNGDIHKEQKWASTYSYYLNNNDKKKMYKVWSARKGNENVNVISNIFKNFITFITITLVLDIINKH
jgi:hypothetical protein